jgi:hypothetical protein
MAVWLLSLAAVVEVATGIALIILPQAVASLLLGADLAGAATSSSVDGVGRLLSKFAIAQLMSSASHQSLFAAVTID